MKQNSKCKKYGKSKREERKLIERRKEWTGKSKRKIVNKEIKKEKERAKERQEQKEEHQKVWTHEN